MDAGCWDRIPLICPRCRHTQASSALQLGQVLSSRGDFILEGLLSCPAHACQARYPILSGVPVVLKDMPRWWRHAALANTAGNSPQLRDYFAELSTIAATQHDKQCLLSTYMDAHYGNGEASTTPPLRLPSSTAYWQELKTLSTTGGPYQQALDLGCAVGRYTFELAQHSELAVGLDLNFDLVAAAARIQRQQVVRYQRQRRGSYFEPVEFPYPAPQNVLFLLADALDPPFEAESFDLVAGLNVLDNVKLPLVLLGQMDALLRRGGTLRLASPYEWRSDICEPGEWLENPEQDAATLVRRIIGENLFPQMQLNYQVLQERAHIPWILRQHERAWRLFLVHLLSARKG